jgi:hypothetical protein
LEKRTALALRLQRRLHRNRPLKRRLLRLLRLRLEEKVDFGRVQNARE